MKAKVFYQDFYLNNCSSLNKDNLQLDKSKAVEVGEVEYRPYCETRDRVCDRVFREFNMGEFLSTKEFQDKVRNQPFEGKHTSMSVGDYVEFEDGEIWVVAVTGWEVIS